MEILYLALLFICPSEPGNCGPGDFTRYISEPIPYEQCGIEFARMEEIATQDGLTGKRSFTCVLKESWDLRHKYLE